MRILDFILKGFAPGVLLGVLAMFLEHVLDARGAVIYSFLAFSIWPATAMLTKVDSFYSLKRSDERDSRRGLVEFRM